MHSAEDLLGKYRCTKCSGCCHYAFYGVYDHAKFGAGEVLAKFPRLRAVYGGAWSVGKLAAFKREWLYFTADPEHSSFISDSEAAED